MEKKIIKRIKAGDWDAFSLLYNQYADYALRVGMAVTRSRANSADAVQETFIRVYRNIDKFDIDKPFKPWFYKILINECRRIMTPHQISCLWMRYWKMIPSFPRKISIGSKNMRTYIRPSRSWMKQTGFPLSSNTCRILVKRRLLKY